ncbi:MAG TPA: substrate-binding domain-containing protein, partial [Halanaerobiales bacterium]|nr:substrate-binding domain-containing protein [Halanaerobiales bacterium]
MKKINLKKILVILATTLFLFSCNTDKKNNELIIFHAGSLSVPFKQIKKQFEKENPDIDVFLESAGSVKCARKIADLNKPCDIMASADYKVIDNLLIPEFTDWNIRFAGNEMAIVYHDKSKYAEEINAL